MRSLRSATLLVLPLALILPMRVAAEGWGTVKGQVIYAGKDTPNQTAKVAEHKDAKVCLKNGPVPLDQLVVNSKNKGTRWVVVWLAKDDDGNADHTAELPTHPSLKNPKKKSVVMDQPCCSFEPHIVVVRSGQDFVGKNSAEIAHNMHITGSKVNQAISQNPILPPGTSLTIKAGQLKPYQLPNTVKCDIHTWMSGYIFVLPHPYFAITDADGKFEIKNAPAGKYRLIMWHEKDGWVLGEGDEADKNGKLITIKADGTTDLGKVELKDK